VKDTNIVPETELQLANLKTAVQTLFCQSLVVYMRCIIS